VRRRLTIGTVAAATTALIVLAGSATGTRRAAAVESPGRLANRCVVVAASAAPGYVRVSDHAYAVTAARAAAEPLYLKPTGLGTYLLFDRGGLLAATTATGLTRTTTPGPSTEWTIAHLHRSTFTITSTAGNRPFLAPATRYSFIPARGCRVYPEAEVGAFGPTFRGADRHGHVFGFADLHVHITANMRAGGEVIYGESFDRYGVTRALSAAGDAQVHGSDNRLDITGNLLHGNPLRATDNHGWPTFKGWPTHDTITHQQVYYVWLKRAWMGGLRLIVAQTVDDHALCEIEPRRDRTCDETQSIIGQIARLYAMQDYIDAQAGGRGRGWFRIVTNPTQARHAIEHGRLAVVIGIESSDLFGCSELLGRPQCTRADIDRGLDLYWRLGVRTLFPVHWVNNAFGGAALESGIEGKAIGALNVAQTGLPFATHACDTPGEVEQEPSNGQPAQCNSLGLTDLGRYLIERMMAKHMMIEADHMSERMRDSVIALAQAHDYPLVSSHNGTGGAWSAAQLTALYRLGGMVSVTPDTAPNLARKILGLRAYASPRAVFGVGLGTDTGGLGSLPGPRPDARANPLRYPFRSYDGHVEFMRERTGDYTYDLNVEGVAHYGLLPDLIADIQQGHGDARALPPLFRSAEAYLETWQRAVAH
jgi:microsomal dipeptidase-like Zn-dependent dipeptidase